MPVYHVMLEPRPPWSWLAPRLTLGGALALPPSQRAAYAAPWPSLVIGCGRSAALFTRMLRKLANRRCHTVQILDPRISPKHWDTVIAPRHDRLKGDNVLHLLGSLNPVDDSWLADGREACPTLADLPRPRVGVLLGGPRRGIAFDLDYLNQLINQLLARQRQEHGSLLVLASRRTPTAMMQTLRTQLTAVPGLLWAGHDDGHNPYPGVLGWADRLVVTPDSVNMLSEACSVGCAVHTLVTGPLPAKLERFHVELRQAGLLHDLNDVAAERQLPLRETAPIALRLQARLTAWHALPSRQKPLA